MNADSFYETACANWVCPLLLAYYCSLFHYTSNNFQVYIRARETFFPNSELGRSKRRNLNDDDWTHSIYGDLFQSLLFHFFGDKWFSHGPKNDRSSNSIRR